MPKKSSEPVGLQDPMEEKKPKPLREVPVTCIVCDTAASKYEQPGKIINGRYICPLCVQLI